jgi:hypothetical protein
VRLAGVHSGMRVLDVGCGAGDVTMLAAGIVGPERVRCGGGPESGHRQPRPPESRRSQLRQCQLEVAAPPVPGRAIVFDAAICRYALVHQSDPVGFLRGIGPARRSMKILVTEQA